ncbi:hypothetical protein M885DRAFT_577083 [Pelagophyceae sp. CCMP2097]|nr:hypothetical protein M885DRAFT_577083 [Pelagophyceae sp. CCMP2097]
MMQPTRSAEGGATAMGAASGATVGYYRAHAFVAALDGHLLAYGLKKEREGGPIAPAIIQQSPLFYQTAIMADVRALSDSQRAQFTQLLKKESDGEGDEDDPDFEGESDDRPGRYAPRASSTSPAPGGAAKRLRIGPAPQPAAEEEEHEQEQCV